VTAGKKGYTGIGIYAAKMLTEVQKGVIEFETSEQEGTTIIVALP
jgi:two-component system sensor histidine kinase/response regulator